MQAPTHAHTREIYIFYIQIQFSLHLLNIVCIFCLHFFTGKYREGQTTADPKTWKANFRCAMNSLPDIEEVKDKSINKGHQAVRVYRMLKVTAKPKGEKSDRLSACTHTSTQLYSTAGVAYKKPQMVCFQLFILSYESIGTVVKVNKPFETLGKLKQCNNIPFPSLYTERRSKVKDAKRRSKVNGCFMTPLLHCVSHFRASRQFSSCAYSYLCRAFLSSPVVTQSFRNFYTLNYIYIDPGYDCIFTL